MIIRISHSTSLRYSQPVVQSISEFRMAPKSDATQTLKSFALHVRPHARVHQFHDFLGNTVHTFSLRSGHDAVDITANSIVLTHPEPFDPAAATDRWPLADQQNNVHTADYLILRGPVHWHSVLHEMLAEINAKPGQPVTAILERTNRLVRQWFAYRKNVTHSGSTIEALIQIGSGVCQDFAHLLLALLRAQGIPARYCSGYVHRTKRKHDAESHAWVEAWLPSAGWVGLDPTIGDWCDPGFVKVAHGRDYSDVPPNRGIYRGNAEEDMSVSVRVEALDELPNQLDFELFDPLSAPAASRLPPPAGRPVADPPQTVPPV